MELVWADGAYTGGFGEWLRRQFGFGWRMEVAHHRDRQLWRYELEEKPRGFSKFCLAVGSLSVPSLVALGLSRRLSLGTTSVYLRRRRP